MAKLCGCLVTSPPPSVDCENSNCIYTPDLLIPSKDAVSVCGELGIIELGKKISYGLCKSKSLTHHVSIVSKSANIASIAYSNGQISYILQDVTGLTTAKFTYEVRCGFYSSTGEVIIVPANNCYNLPCPDGFICDKCDGCIEQPDGNITFVDPSSISYTENDVNFIN